PLPKLPLSGLQSLALGLSQPLGIEDSDQRGIGLLSATPELPARRLRPAPQVFEVELMDQDRVRSTQVSRGGRDRVAGFVFGPTRGDEVEPYGRRRPAQPGVAVDVDLAFF